MLTPELIEALPDAIQVLTEEIEYLDGFDEKLKERFEAKRQHLVTVRNALAIVHKNNS